MRIVRKYYYEEAYDRRVYGLTYPHESGRPLRDESDEG